MKDVLRQQQNSSDWGSDVKELLSKGLNKPRKGHDAGDHPPITPTRAASRDQFDTDTWKIYDYVVRHFIGTVSYNCKYQSTTVNIKIGSEDFSFTGKKLTDPGFTAVMTWQALTQEESVPKLNPGDELVVKEVKLVDRQTSPPDYLTEADLITLMEKHGIGETKTLDYSQSQADVFRQNFKHQELVIIKDVLLNNNFLINIECLIIQYMTSIGLDDGDHVPFQVFSNFFSTLYFQDKLFNYLNVFFFRH